MKILLTHRFFWPDTAPYAIMLRTIGEALDAAGHDVHVFASMPSYRKADGSGRVARAERLGPLQVRRCAAFADEKRHMLRRLINVVLYCACLFFHILRLRPDVVTASTFPPVVAGWTASLGAKLVGARFVYHMMDIHPEISGFSGGRMGRGFPAKVLRWLDNQTLRRASRIIVLSSDMADTLRARGVEGLQIVPVANFELESGQAPAPDGTGAKPEGITRVIFAGNIGNFQALPVLAEGIAQCFARHPQLQLMFLGDGSALPKLKARWNDNDQVVFAPFMPFAQAQHVIGGADIGLVSLAPDIYRAAYPSKVATYFKLGLPVLALVEPSAQLARDVQDSGAGEVPQTATAPDIAQALERMLGDLGRYKAAAAEQGARDLRGEALVQWTTLMAEIGTAGER